MIQLRVFLTKFQKLSVVKVTSAVGIPPRPTYHITIEVLHLNHYIIYRWYKLEGSVCKENDNFRQLVP